MHAIITENDVSQWDDVTGKAYHFPSRYKRILMPGTQVIYYKGNQKQKGFNRLSPEAHYFGKAVIGQIKQVGNKNEYTATIDNFESFDEPILAKQNGKFLETIPENKKSNYWRDGVRSIDEKTYKRILVALYPLDQEVHEDQFESEVWEGKKKLIYTTVYERNPKLRKDALKEHGYTCKACGLNFGEFYGEQFSRFIHVHHIEPISKRGEAAVNPKTDLIPVCPNCHWVIHSGKGTILTVDQVREFIRANKK